MYQQPVVFFLGGCGGGGRGGWLEMFFSLKGPLKYLLMPLLGKNQFAITLHMCASIGPNLDNSNRKLIWISL